MPDLNNTSSPTRPRIVVSEQQTASTAGGQATAGAFFTRVLNTKSVDSAGIATLASNELTIPAGSYDVDCMSPAYRVDGFTIRLFDVTGNSVLLVGTAQYSVSGADTSTAWSFIKGRFTISVQSAIRVEMRVATTKATNGLGIPSTYQTEQYTTLVLEKVI